MKNIAVVTVNYNTAKDTQAFLASLAKINRVNFTIQTIVVDNGSTEKFQLSPQEQLHTTLIYNADNIGFSGGYNIGIKTALENGANAVMIVNNDTLLDPNILIHLEKVLYSEDVIGLTVPKMYFAKGHEFHKDRYTKEQVGKVLWYAGGSVDWNNVQSIHRGVDEVDDGQYNRTEKVDFASGCCMLIKKEVFEKVGMFDERYFLYYEDADLCERMKRAGYMLYYVPRAFLYHVNASSSGGAGNVIQDYYITRNQMLFGMSYAPLRAKIALLRQSSRLLQQGRPKQKKAIKDYFLRRFGKGENL
ncbi:MAG: glycosyltransferase family 2 protein [Candidatus Levyibacteriota bacterium]